MAEATQKQDTTKDAPQDEDKNPGTPDAGAYASGDLAVAENAGITEGEVKALRDDAGLNRLAGHEADIHAYSLTPEGKEYLSKEKERQAAAKEEAKKYDAQFDRNGLTEAEAKYREAVKG